MAFFMYCRGHIIDSLSFVFSPVSIEQMHQTKIEAQMMWLSSPKKVKGKNSKQMQDLWYVCMFIYTVIWFSDRVENVLSEPDSKLDEIMTCAICMDDFNQVKSCF